MPVEYADDRGLRIGSSGRRIKLPDGAIRYGSTPAREIAQILRKHSKLGRREARIAAAEEKVRLERQ